MSALKNEVVLVEQPKKTSRFRRLASAVAAGGTYVMVAPANAAMDVTEVTTGLTAQVANIETIGIAILGVLVVIAGLSMLRRIVR